MQRWKKVLSIMILGLLLFGLTACHEKQEESTNGQTEKDSTYYCDLSDGWQIAFPIAWENNYIAEKTQTEDGNFTTLYYAPNGEKTEFFLLGIGVMPKENWSNYDETELPGIYLTERDDLVYYSVFPEKEETKDNLYQQMLEEAHDASFQTIKKVENLPQDPNAPITSPDDSVDQ